MAAKIRTDKAESLTPNEAVMSVTPVEDMPPAEAIEFVPVEVLVNLTVPARKMPDANYRSRYIEIQGLSASQADAAKALFEGLFRRQARLANGRYVKNVADSVRFMLESIAAQLNEAESR